MFATLNTNTMAVSSDKCDVTESRVVKLCSRTLLQCFHHTDMIEVNNLKSMDRNKMWEMKKKKKKKGGDDEGRRLNGSFLHQPPAQASHLRRGGAGGKR